MNFSEYQERNKDKTLWIVATKEDVEYCDKIAEEITTLTKAYPPDFTAHEVVLSFAQQYDANCGDSPMLYEGLELVVYAMRFQNYNPHREFELQADQFVVRGQLLPNYSVSRKLREECTNEAI